MNDDCILLREGSAQCRKIGHSKVCFQRVNREASRSSDAIYHIYHISYSEAQLYPCSIRDTEPELGPSPTSATQCCTTSGKSLTFSELHFLHCQERNKTQGCSIPPSPNFSGSESPDRIGKREWSSELPTRGGAFIPLPSSNLPNEEALQVLKSQDSSQTPVV